ncbi:hypothetical protein AMJ49_04200 [Parcubacteria bacterium DG_74_2]|nr:MAG: hypothetical protein AMJ49_04200 [Parcubacteria bacterium DG_74_2]
MNKLSNKTVLITGGGGFIGSYLTLALNKKGYRIVVLTKFLPNKRDFPTKVKFYKIDICSKKLDKIFQKEHPEIIYHLAAYLPKSNIEKSNSNIENIKSNVLGTLNILELSRKYGIKKIIFSSSAAVYGNPKVFPTPEDYPVKPMFLYGLAKFTDEKLFEIYYRLYNLHYIIFRYSNVYGPGQKPNKQGSLIANFIDKISRNKQPIINGKGEQTRDYVYIDDVINANFLAMKTNKVGIYNVGGGIEISINDIFYKICQIFGKEIKPEYNPLVKEKMGRSFLEIKKIKKELNWQPKINIDDGLKKIINYLRNI